MTSKRKYNVLDLYETMGPYQSIARSSRFTNCILAANCAYLAWMAVDIDNNAAESLQDSNAVFMIMTIAFLCIFLFDIVIRLLAFKAKAYAFKDSAFNFDLCLLLLLILSIVLGFAASDDSALYFVSNLFFLLQGLRFFTLARAMPELQILLKGFFSASRSVFFVLMLQVVLSYIFAMALCSWTSDTSLKHDHFITVPQSMRTLLVHGTFFQHTEISTALGEDHALLEVVFLLYVFLSFCNLVICAGFICEVLSAVANTEKDVLIAQMLEATLGRRFPPCDEDDGLSKDQFQEMLKSSEVQGFMEMLCVDVDELGGMADMIYGIHEQLPLADLIKAMLQMQGTKNAALKDVMAIRKDMYENAQKTAGPSMLDIQKAISDGIGPLREKLEAIENSMEELKGQQPARGNIPGGILSDL